LTGQMIVITSLLALDRRSAWRQLTGLIMPLP
jgi:hypothetical protein